MATLQTVITHGRHTDSSVSRKKASSKIMMHTDDTLGEGGGGKRSLDSDETDTAVNCFTAGLIESKYVLCVFYQGMLAKTDFAKLRKTCQAR